MATIIELALNQTYTNSAEISSTYLVEYLNNSYNDIYNFIVNNIDQYYFWQEWKTNLINWQKEYEIDDVVERIYKLENVSVKSWDTYYIAQVYNTSNFYNDKSVYSDKQSYLNPLYEFKAKSIIIYPTPKSNIFEWLKISWIYRLPALEATATASDLFPWYNELQQFSELVYIGMMQYIFQSQGKTNERNDALNLFNSKLQDLRQALMVRNKQPNILTINNWELYNLM